MQEPHLELIRERAREKGVDGKRRSNGGGGGGEGSEKKRSPEGNRKRERMNFGKQKRDHAETESQRRAEKKVNGDTG